MPTGKNFVGLAVGKEMFFDRKEVVAALGRASVKVLSRFGAFVRKTAQQSIKSRKGVSAPGSPPSSHRGTLKRGVVFGYDLAQRSVVIGARPVSGTVTSASLHALEAGGRSLIKRKKDGKLEPIDIKPRPFMGPAFRHELPGFPQLWANSVR